MKIHLPLFPESEFLNNKWWHRLAKVVILGLTTLLLIYALIYVKSYISGAWMDNVPQRWPPRIEDIIVVIAFYILLTVIYRAILYIAFNDKCKNTKNKFR